MASYPQSLSRLTAPQMSQSKGQPKPMRGKMGLQNAAARRLQNKSKRSGKMGLNKGSY